jgi:hypothetical protein
MEYIPYDPNRRYVYIYWDDFKREVTDDAEFEREFDRQLQKSFNDAIKQLFEEKNDG